MQEDKKRKQGKGKRKNCNTSRLLELAKDGIGLVEGIKCIIK